MRNGVRVGGIYGASESVFGVVCQFDGVLKITRRGHSQHGAENLFAEDGCGGRHVGKNGGFKQQGFAVNHLAAKDQSRL